MAKDAVARQGCRVFALAFNQLASAEKIESGLHRALRQSGFFGERTKTGRNWFPLRAHCLTVKPDINQVGRGLAIMTDDVTHQHVEHVAVDRNGIAKPGHEEK